MEWERETCLLLIDQYEQFPELWNPSHGLYYNKNRKHECWSLIARALDCSTEEIKKKMESLLGSFRRERAKGKKTIGTGKAAQEVYVSKWFAFDRMTFLMDRHQPRATLTLSRPTMAADDESESTSTKQEAASEEEDYPPILTSQSYYDYDYDYSDSITPLARVITSSSSSSSKPRQKRQRLGAEDDDKMEEALGILKDAVNKTPTLQLQQDECGIFGQHVANKLRKYDPRTRAMVQQEINTALFNADMKLFPQPTSSFVTSNKSEHKAGNSL